jgi:hypothetical protein
MDVIFNNRGLLNFLIYPYKYFSTEKNMLFVLISVKECLFVTETRNLYLLLHSESQGYQPQRIIQSCKGMVTEHISGFLFSVG